MGSDEYVQWPLGHRALQIRSLAGMHPGSLVYTSFSLEVMSLCTEGLLFTVLGFPLHVQFIVGLLIGMK